MINLAVLNIKDIVGVLLVITGIFDAFKYTIQANKIKREHTSVSQSRMSLNLAVINDLVKILYAILALDIYIFITSLLALVCMLHCWYIVYLYYNYKTYPKKITVQRPSVWVYLTNSFVPNNKRKHL